MSINRERLEKRREELKGQMEQLKANFNAVAGAIADLDYLLNEDNETPKKGKKE